MKRLVIIGLCAAVLLASGMRADADMLLLGVGSLGTTPPVTTQVTNDGATLTLTDDAGTNHLVAQ